MCNVPLTSVDGVDVIVGEQAHIRSGAAGGPRCAPDFPVERVDRYENFVLLCPQHHMVVDENESVFTTELLLPVKDRHKRRVGQALHPSDPGWTKLPDVVVVSDGIQLVAMLSQVRARVISNDHPQADSERDAIARFLQDAADWSDFLDEIGPSGHV
jgi:hypothetical protein